MIYDSSEQKECYYPPILGNGDIILAPDPEGALGYTCEADFPYIKKGYDGCIFRAGRRLTISNKTGNRSRIVSFGVFRFECGERLVHFTQELDVACGTVRSVCDYENGTKIQSECFVCQDANIYVLRKRIFGARRPVTFTYELCGYDSATEKAISSYCSETDSCGASVSFVIDGNNDYRGKAALLCDGEGEYVCDGKKISICSYLGEGDEITYFFCLEDDLCGECPEKRVAQYAHSIGKLGFEGLRAQTHEAWKSFFDAGFVRTSDQKLNSVYMTALYNIKCYTTRWSIPVGIENASWDGTYFAFDEYYMFHALISSGRAELARRVPEFRLNICLDRAVKRATHLTEEQARFAWQSDEYGQELSPPGFWLEHIFHMAIIALGAYEYYEYTQDKDYLAECYRMIRACAKFFTLNCIHKRDDGTYYVGKCTDLERLGSSVENPFFTACGVIKTLRILAASAHILGVDREYAAECEEIADGLFKNLPVEDGKFVPYIGCPQKSIAVFSGKFPFDVIADTDTRLSGAWDDFVKNESEFGNMYHCGKNVSPWYAVWKAIAYARVGRAEDAYTSLRQSHASVGCFDEMFEINEPNNRYRPYFATAAGVYLSAVNESIVRSDGDNIYLLDAYPLDGELEFGLALKGGIYVRASVFDKSLRHIDIFTSGHMPTKTFKLWLCGEYIGKLDSKKKEECTE